MQQIAQIGDKLVSVDDDLRAITEACDALTRIATEHDVSVHAALERGGHTLAASRIRASDTHSALKAEAEAALCIACLVRTVADKFGIGADVLVDIVARIIEEGIDE